MIIAAAPLVGCEANQSYSCTEDGLNDLEALGSKLTSAFPEAGPPIGYDDCDSSGKASVQAAHPGGVASLEGSLPPEWQCGPGRGPTWNRDFRCTIEGRPTHANLQKRDAENVTVYLRPLAAAD